MRSHVIAVKVACPHVYDLVRVKSLFICLDVNEFSYQLLGKLSHLKTTEMKETGR